MKKNHRKMLITTPILLLMPISTISCNVPKPIAIPPKPNHDDHNDNDGDIKKIKLEFDDYFDEWYDYVYKSRNNLVERITHIVKKNHLDEWNNYFQKKRLSKVFDIKLSDYSKKLEHDNGGYEDFKWNKLTDTNKNIATSIYNKQDHQFQYFNDFENIFNEEDNKNHEDFLYLRWKYYSIFGARLYNNPVQIFEQPLSIKSKEEKDFSEKKVKDISFADWADAISGIVLLDPTSYTKFVNIIYSFLSYYGVVIDISQFSKFLDGIGSQIKDGPIAMLEEFKKGIKDNIDQNLNEIGKDFFGGELEEKFKKLYDEIKQEIKKEDSNEDLTIKEFLKNFTKIVSHYKEFIEAKKEYHELISKWQNLGISGFIGEFMDRMEHAFIPNWSTNFVSDINFGLQNSVLHAKLCAKDMLMRLINKKDPRDPYQHIWEAKRKRAFEIYKKMCEYSNLVIKSLDPSNGMEKDIIEVIKNKISFVFPNVENDPLINFINKLMRAVLTPMVKVTLKPLLDSIRNFVKSIFTKIIDISLGQMVEIKYNDYTTKK